MLKSSERFFKVYAGLPLEERKVPIVIVGNQPINWILAYDEVSNNTERGKKILAILIELRII